MSRFVRPVMEVIRFTEADVIVSSITGSVEYVKLGNILDGHPDSIHIEYESSGNYWDLVVGPKGRFHATYDGTEYIKTIDELKEMDQTYDKSDVKEIDSDYAKFSVFNGLYHSDDNGYNWFQNQ